MGRGLVAGYSEFWNLHFSFVGLKSGFKGIFFLQRPLPLRGEDKSINLQAALPSSPIWRPRQPIH